MKFFKTPYNDTLPLPYPILPLLDKNNVEQTTMNFNKWLKDCQYTIDENDRRFEEAMKRIKLCAFLNGFWYALSSPYSFSDKDKDKFSISYMRHFKWCPSDAWKTFK